MLLANHVEDLVFIGRVLLLGAALFVGAPLALFLVVMGRRKDQ